THTHTQNVYRGDSQRRSRRNRDKEGESIYSWDIMRVCVFRLHTHQWCFLLCNVVLFHALLFGGDIVEEFLLQSSPVAYTDRAVLELREHARKLDLSDTIPNSSQIYPINSKPCLYYPDLLFLTIVFSSPNNTSHRDAIRSSWANQTMVQDVAVRTVFFLNPSTLETEHQVVWDESARHGDIVQCEGPLSQDHWGQVKLALRWVLLFCPRARFVVLTEDTVFLNVPALGTYLLTLRTHPEDLYLGRVIHHASPERNYIKPHYVSLHLYPDRSFPDYCSGPAFLMSQDVVRKVYVASKDVALALPADVLIGLCARAAGVVATHSARFSGEWHVHYNPCCYNFLFSSALVDAELMAMAWRDLGKGRGRHCSMLQTYYSLVVCKTVTYLNSVTFFSGNNTKV
ncbi:beta-1,3-galactosyltransferase 9, partial [Clarias gariepinus]|uniref:beta-1,3-galactosyltransferase 9 n=1 Tax=Clarias gariepinus TaxID=13013 RepID=UPI00234D213C